MISRLMDFIEKCVRPKQEDTLSIMDELIKKSDHFHQLEQKNPGHEEEHYKMANVYDPYSNLRAQAQAQLQQSPLISTYNQAQLNSNQSVVYAQQGVQYTTTANIGTVSTWTTPATWAFAVPSPSGMMVDVTFRDFYGNPVSIQIDSAYVEVMSHVADQHMTNKPKQIMPVLDFGLDELEVAEKLMEDMNGSHP